MTGINPGEVFLSTYRVPTTRSEFDAAITAYTDFLRDASGLPDELPVDLDHICTHFGINVAEGALLEGQRGMVVPFLNTVVVNDDDGEARRRFTIAHELLELLFGVMQERIGSPGLVELLRGQTKERLCDRGASRLLLPRNRLAQDVRGLPLSFDTASTIASSYGTSLTAAVVSLLDFVPTATVMAMWRRKLKPSQQKKGRDSSQLALGDEYVTVPVEKMRLLWTFPSTRMAYRYFPNDISVEDSSAIGVADLNGVRVTQQEYMNINAIKATVLVEAMPVKLGDRSAIMSLIHEEVAEVPLLQP